jgi:hypothetical protein
MRAIWQWITGIRLHRHMDAAQAITYQLDVKIGNPDDIVYHGA